MFAAAEAGRTAYNGRMSQVIDSAFMDLCRRTLREKTVRRSEGIALRLESARARAADAASVLRHQFGAHEVIIFGSVADGIGFSERSDIDLAISGIPPARFWSAGAAAERAAGGFELDLIDLKFASEGFALHIRNSGMRL